MVGQPSITGGRGDWGRVTRVPHNLEWPGTQMQIVPHNNCEGQFAFVIITDI